MTELSQTRTTDSASSEAAPASLGATVSRQRVVLTTLAVVSGACAVIHFAVAGMHWQDYWAFGAFMLASAWLQLGWSVAAVLRPSRLLLVLGMLLNGGIVVTYVITRTVGDVVGPTPHTPEDVGLGDGLCTVFEGLLALACLVLLVTADRTVAKRHLLPWTAATAVVSAVVLSFVLVDGGSEMVMPSSDGGAPMAMDAASGGTPSTLSLPTASPAGNITMPAMTQMEAGMKMAGPMCSTMPTKAQQSAAVDLVNASWASSQRFADVAAAKAAGYRPITPVGLPVVHYLSPKAYRATMRGGPVLDTTAPQSLVYANTPNGSVLVAAMYIMAPFGSATPPQPGGCLTQWHVHTNLCLGRGGVVALADPGCPTGSFNVVTPPMLHVWFAPIPGGPTAIDAADAQVVQAASAVHAAHADKA